MTALAARLAGDGSGVTSLKIAGFILLLALPAALVPRELVLLSVFLFAGPHNWMELRYFLTRLPSRWGRARMFFLTGIVGALLLGVVSIAMQWSAHEGSLGTLEAFRITSHWNAAFVFWVGVLVALHLKGRRRWAAAALAAAAWWGVLHVPVFWFGLALVYLHPLVALVYFDLDLRRRRPEWRSLYRRGLLAILPAGALIFWLQSGTGPVSSSDPMIWRLAIQSGATQLAESPRALIGFHGFLQLLHYAVWLIGVPLIALRSLPVEKRHIPMHHRGGVFRAGIALLLVASTIGIFALWGGFLVDTALSWDIYFAVAIFHVLVEFPFLIRNV